MFNKLSISMVCLYLLASPVDSARILVKTQEKLKEVLQQFIDDSELDICKDKCKGMLIGNIFEGLLTRDLVKDIAWNGKTLTVHLTVARAYGQIATRSKVPVAWVVDEEFVGEVVPGEGQTTLKMTGLHTEVSKQGIETYEKVMQAQIVDTSWRKPVEYNGPVPMIQRAADYEAICGTPSTDCDEYLEYERKAASLWLQFNSKAWIKDSDKKISKIVATAIKSPLINWDNWGSILFSMVTSAGKNIDELIFEDKVGVIATASLWKGSQSYDAVIKYSLLSKAQTIGGKALTNCPSMLAGTVAKRAKSGWGFGMLFAHGDDAVKQQVKNYPKAEPDKLVDLFSLCEKGAVDADPECSSGDPGRIHWTEALPEDFL